MEDIHQILKKYWGYSSFRPLQEDIIHAVLSGRDTLALLPTGGGKSICYQVPALVMDGMCLVVSPLIALMKDQVEGLRKRNLTAYAIYSGMARKEVINTLRVVTESNCKFLYVSPERLETALFKEYLPGMNLALVAVDEAHCVSQWGYDFRPPYLRIASIREELPGIPLLALTASATPDVQQDICDKLQFKDPAIFRQSFERSNLSYSVFRVDAKMTKLSEILRNVPGTGIVYCRSRRRTREISDLLQMQDISSDYYHAGLTQDERNRKQEDWINSRTRVIVCTNAFGMGIDKPDVRTVVHVDVPDCLENYYQEAGRAGRDGKTSYAVLLYQQKDTRELEEQLTLRFPTLPEIREVYQALANYLQLPTGTGAGRSFDFEIADFVKKFKLNGHTALYALKTLEQEGFLQLNEQVFLPSTVRFNTTKDYLYGYERDHPQQEPLIKALLRSYEGIFDYPGFISEALLAGLLKRDSASIIQQLTALHQAHVIEYSPRKDKPQLFLLRDRIKTEELVIDKARHEQRRERFRLRAAEMIRYVNEEAECRSRIIGQYFGDRNIRSCGICDNCLRRKALALSSEEFEEIRKRISDILSGPPLPIRDLLSGLRGIRREKAWKVIEFLQSENKMEMDEQGRVSVKS